MNSAGNSGHRSYAVRTEGVGGTLRDPAALIDSCGPRDLKAAIRFAQAIEPDEWVTKTVRIKAVEPKADSGGETIESTLASFPIYPRVDYRGRQLLLPPEKVADAHVTGGPIVGFRCWRMQVVSRLTGGVEVVDRRPTPELAIEQIELLAMYQKAVWTEAQVRFVCEQFHETPQASCKCGVHAYHKPNEALGEYVTGQGMVRRFPAVVGVVSGHGEVLLHGRGWRGEEAHVLAFADLGKDGAEARKLLARLWDIPVIPYSELEDFALSKGRIIRKEQAERGQLDGGAII